MRLAHISDTHCKLLKHHEDYRDIFNQLYETLRNEKIDYIIHTGDLVHNKTTLSAEMVQIVAEFLKSMADIAPLYLILGNHDLNLKNDSRQDAITPIIHALNHPRIKLLKDAGETKLDDNFVLNSLSICDRKNWIKPTDSNKINIALYHGSIAGSKTDLGWSMKNTDDDLSIFDPFNFVMLGDIHLQQYFRFKPHGGITRDLKPTIAYAGSTVQQGFGENTEKGILIWDIKDKNNWSITPHYFNNPHPFVTINYEEDKEYNIPKDCYLRIIFDKYYSRDQIQSIKEEFQISFEPKSITIIDKKNNDIEQATEFSNVKKLNLRDENVQEQLIKEFLSPEGLDEETISAVLELNKKYNLSAEISDNVARNVKWKLESFQWDNLFNYKEDNRIDFDDLSGVVGIFGKNYSGKSSIIDGLLYTLFNSTSKNIRKNFDIINENKESGKGFVSIGIEGGHLLISRETDKNIKKSKGKLVEESKTNVSFELLTDGANIMQLNGIDRNETDKNIRKDIGTIEDFCNTSLSTQHGSLDFINSTSMARKETLANFLDLQIFERKHMPANKDANELKTLIKKQSGKDYVKMINEAKIKYEQSEEALTYKLSERTGLGIELDIKKEELKKIIDDLSKTDKVIDYNTLIARRKAYQDQIEIITGKLIHREKMILEHIETMQKIEEVLKKLDINELKKKQEISNGLLKEIDKLLNDKRVKTQSLSIHQKNSLNLKNAACGTTQFNECVFKKSALDSLEEIDIVQLALNSLSANEISLKLELSKLEPEKVNEYIDKHQKLKQKLDQTINSKLVDEKAVSDFKASILGVEKWIDDLNKDIHLYESNKDLYENIMILQDKRDNLQKEVRQLESNLVQSEKDRTTAIRESAAIEQIIKTYEEQMEELSRLNKEYSAYELFLKCVHNNGIPFELIKNNLPIINEEMNKMLSNVVEFEAFFENEDGKLEIYLQHPNKKPRSIENCSGAEKSLVAMAIRLALVKCGSLPTSDVFILDEPATALDAEHLESFVKVLDMIKSEFKIVLLVTHIDALKDSVDKIIQIEKDEQGYAFLN